MNVLGFSGDQWTAISSISTAASAISSAAGLIFVGLQIRTARKSSDNQSLQNFMQGITEREQHLQSALDESGKEQAFLEFANYLELQAAALHGGLFSGVTREIVSEKINDSLAVIELSDVWCLKMKSAESTHTTFKHLRRFIGENRFAINRAKAFLVAVHTVDSDGI